MLEYINFLTKYYNTNGNDKVHVDKKLVKILTNITSRADMKTFSFQKSIVYAK